MEKIWLENYQDGVSKEINPDKYSSLVALLNDSFSNFAQRKAFSNIGESLTFADVDRLSTNFASYLNNVLKFNKGDRFVIMLPNVLQYPVVMIGILRAGLVVVNANPLYTPAELKHLLNDSQARGIITLNSFAHIVAEATPDTFIENIIITSVGDLFPCIKRCVVNFVVKYIKKMEKPYSIPSAVKLLDELSLGGKHQFNQIELLGSDLAYLQYTGGTTGRPKGAMLTHRNMVANVLQAREWLYPVIRGRELSNIITALPLYHIFSLTANCLLFFSVGSCAILITNPRDLRGFIKELKRQPFFAITGVNTLFNGLLNNDEFAKINFSNLAISLGGGMPVQSIVAKRWKQVTGVPLIEGYGLTEASPVVCINPLDLPDHNGSIGLPVPSTEIKLIDEDGKEVPMGSRGELMVRGPQVMLGYWQQEAETENVLDDKGWLRTGDIARVDEKGFVYIVDRKKDMILVSGFNVYPNEIEEIIASFEPVKEVAVVGVKQEDGLERVKAFIVLKKDASASEKDIINFCRKYLTSYKIPKSVEFRTELPKTNVGKVLRRALKDEK